MKTKLAMTISSVWTFFVLVSCSQRLANNVHDSQNKDTSYSNTTELLKSNIIPDSIFEMTALRHLTIMGMDCDYGDKTHCWDIAEISSKIKNLKNLVTLTLNVNSIQVIPVELSELKNLKELDLTDNVALSSVDNVEKIVSLEHLFLHGCGLTRLPDKIGNLKNLKKLGLVGNHIDPYEQERIKQALPDCTILF